MRRAGVQASARMGLTLPPTEKGPKLSVKQLRDRLPKMPFNALIGIRVLRVHPDGVTIEVPVREELLNAASNVHGGVSATMADSAAGIAINRHFGGKRRLTTVELKINYFRPMASGKVRARAYVIRAGTRIAVARVDIFDNEDNLAATALVTYMLLEAI